MASDFISREAAMSMPCANGQYDHEHANEHFICGLETYKEWLEQIPAADVRPVVHGEWEPPTALIPFAYDIAGVITWASEMRCSKCGFSTKAIEGRISQYNLCPSCGADMRPREEGEDDKTDEG